ncbi:MAG: DUF2815 family protein [Patescibacteria group bacterium]|nr:DUF2815 family protein [Patescibacteria group bacterium]
MSDWENEWDFRENLENESEEAAAKARAGQWSTASKQKLNLNSEDKQMTATATAGKKKIYKVTTPEFRVSFPAVFAPRKINQNDPNEKPKYSVQMLFRVKATAKSQELGEKVVDIEPLRAAVRQLLTDKFGADRTQWPTNMRLPFRLGTEPEKKDKDGYGEGIIFCGASSTQNKPGLVDSVGDGTGKPRVIIDPNEFYGGCYARATINAYWYDRAGNKGVSFGLMNIQKLRDGQPFSSRVKAEDEFDAIEQPAGEGASAAAQPAQAAGSEIGV